MPADLIYAEYAQSIGAIAIYALQETSGTSVTDYSGNSYTGSIFGTGITQNVNTSPSNTLYSSYEFTGSGYINLGTSNTYAPPFTGQALNGPDYYINSGYITAWIKANAPNSGGGTIAYWNNFGVSVNDLGYLTIFQSSPGFSTQIPQTTNLMDGNEHFLCVFIQKFDAVRQTFSGGQTVYPQSFYILVSVWIDNVLVINAEDIGATPMDVTYPPSSNLYTQFYNMKADISSIGGNNDGSNAFVGQLNNVGFFPQTLTSAQLTELYVIGTSPYNSVKDLVSLPLGIDDVPLLNHTPASVPASYAINANGQIINQAPVHFMLVNHVPSSAISGYNFNASFTILPTDLIGFLRLDFQRALQQLGDCPPDPAPVIITPRTTSTPKISLISGFYYRIPIDTTQTIQGQPIPKYLSQLGYPFSAFVYPNGDTYQGYMIVKTLNALATVPFDVTILTETEVNAELNNEVNLLFAL